MFPDSVIRLADDKVCTSNDVVQAFHTDFRQVFAYFLRQEREEVHPDDSLRPWKRLRSSSFCVATPTGQVFW